MASKFVAQVLIYTTNVVTRAFVDAYRQAAANAAKGGGAAAQQATKNGAKSGDKMKTGVAASKMSFGGIDIAQARQVLNVRENDSQEVIKKHFEHLFEINEKKKGGSFYLQSKVVRAKEALDWLHAEQEKAKNPTKTSNSTKASSSAESSKKQ
eukprot:CFRG6522T1